MQPRHPIALAQQALSIQAVCGGRLTLGLGVSHHWVIDEMLGLPYERPVPTMRAHLDVLDAAFAGRARSTSRTTCSGCTTRSTSPTSRPRPCSSPPSGRSCCSLAGERTDGTILWMADERAIGSHVVPRLTAAAEAAGRPAPRVVAGVPVCVCGDDEVDAAVARTNRILAEAEVSPNYQTLLDQGDARQVGDLLAAGSESAVEKRLRSFADAGVTDLSVRVVPIGDDRDALLASMRRTRDYLASLNGSL